MNTQTETPRAVTGDNAPPTPIETVVAHHDNLICETANWADGQKVETEAQMLEVDKLIKGMKTYRAELTKAGKEQTDPLHKAWKAEVAAVKVYTDDADMMQSALVACVSPFKTKLADEKAEATRKAQAEAWEATRKAQEAARAVNTADIEQQRAAAAAMAEAEAAQRKANAASKDKVLGMRTVTRYEVTDHRALLHWIAKYHKDDITAFVDAWAQKNHKPDPGADGLNVWQEKEAF